MVILTVYKSEKSHLYNNNVFTVILSNLMYLLNVTENKSFELYQRIFKKKKTSKENQFPQKF